MVFWYSEDAAMCLSMHCIHESVYVLPAASTAALCSKIIFSMLLDAARSRRNK